MRPSPLVGPPAGPTIAKVRELLAEGREQGCLSGEHITDVLADVDLTPEQLENILTRLTDQGIGIIEGDETVMAGEDEPPALDLSIRTPGVDPLRTYLKEIAKVPLLSAEEEVSLARRIEDRDMEAKRTMVEANLRLVVSIAKRHVGRGLPCST